MSNGAQVSDQTGKTSKTKKPISGVQKQLKPKEPVYKGYVTIMGQRTYYFVNGVLDKYDFLAKTNEALAKAAEYDQRSPRQVTDEEYLDLEKLTKDSRNAWDFETERIVPVAAARQHVESVLELLNQVLDSF